MVIGGMVAGFPAIAQAHNAPLDRRVAWHDWNPDPVTWLGFILLSWLYQRGWTAMHQRPAFAAIMPARRAYAFWLGLLLVGVAIVSPLDLLGEQLAWAHMVQHMLLMTVAAPLMVMGAPWLVCLWGLSLGQRQAYGRLRQRLDRYRPMWNLLCHALAIWALHALAMWVWHAPPLYQAALRTDWVHDLQHLMFFAAACLFWRLLLDPLSRFRLSTGIALVCLFTTTLHATMLGVFMTLAPKPWYPDYQESTTLWGLTLLEDQQLAGLIMWMPACAAYAVAALLLLAKGLQEPADSVLACPIHRPAPRQRQAVVNPAVREEPSYPT